MEVLLLGCYLSMSNALRITTCSNCYLELSRTYKHHEGFFTVLSSLRGFCPAQTRDKLKRFLDSILQKGGKMRSLVRELKDKYSSCDSTTGCLDYLIYIYNDWNPYIATSKYPQKIYHTFGVLSSWGWLAFWTLTPSPLDSDHQTRFQTRLPNLS